MAKQKQKIQSKSNENKSQEPVKELKKIFDKRNFYTLGDSGLVFLLALVFPLMTGLVIGYIAIFIAQKTGFQFSKEGASLTELLSHYVGFSIFFAMLAQIVFVVIIFAFHFSNRIQFSALKISVKKTKPLTAILSCLLGAIFMLGFVWLIEGCITGGLESIGVNTGDGTGIPLSNGWWLVLNLVLLGVVPAVCEEIIFRGIIYQGVRSKFSTLVSALLTALLFALVHQSIVQFIYPFVLGFVLCIIFERTDNLVYTMLVHMFNNFATIIFSFVVQQNGFDLSKKGEIWKIFPHAWWGWLVALALAGVTCLLFWLFDKYYLQKHQKNELEKVGETAEKPSKLPIPISMIVGIVFAVFIIVINLFG